MHTGGKVEDSFQWMCKPLGECIQQPFAIFIWTLKYKMFKNTNNLSTTLKVLNVCFCATLQP